MANRYWVGGAGTWNTTSTTNWSDSSGGASGASVPTIADSVFFDQAGTYTVTMTGALACLDITVSAGTVTFATGTTPTLNVRGSMSLLAGTVWNSTGTITFTATTTGQTITTNGTSLNGGVTFNGAGGAWTLGSALTISSVSSLSILQGTFSTSNYSVSCGIFSSSGSLTRAINLGSSTITYGVAISGAIFTLTGTNLTFNAGTSTFTSTANNIVFNSVGHTFYNVVFGSIAPASNGFVINGANTFNTLSFAGRVSPGIAPITFAANQTISTLTLNAGTAAAYRAFLTSNTIGTQRTLTVTTLTAGVADYDFRDIAITGAAAPLTGTRFGDCKGNSGITFQAAKTVYWRQGGSASWAIAGNGSWSLTSGGVQDPTAFPLAQDTAIFPAATFPTSGSTSTINGNYNIGTIDMSLRTANTMTLATGAITPTIYGNWINGTGTTLTGTGQLTFAGRGSQTITSAGKTFTQGITVTTPGGSVTLQDAFTTTSSTQSGLGGGTFDANGYNFTAIGYSSNNTGVRTIAIGSGTWTLNGTGNAWNTPTITNLTVTGTGTISLTNASAKTFAGGGIQTYPTLNQGGAGRLTISGVNKFANITNTAIGNIAFPILATTTVSDFNVSGNSTTRVQLRPAASGFQFTLSKSSGIVSVDWLDIEESTATGGATWYAGANSLNTGNNFGWIFTAPPSVSYGGNFFAFF